MQHKKAFKKLTPSGAFRFYSRSGKRISKKKYYALLKRRSNTIKSVKINTPFAKGRDYFKKVSIFFKSTSPQTVSEKINTIVEKIISKIKNPKNLLYIQLSGDLLCEELIEIFRSTRLSLFSEYKIADFRKGEISRTVEKIYEILSLQFYDKGEITDFHLKTVSVNERQ